MALQAARCLKCFLRKDASILWVRKYGPLQKHGIVIPLLQDTEYEERRDKKEEYGLLAGLSGVFSSLCGLLFHPTELMCFGIGGCMPLVFAISQWHTHRMWLKRFHKDFLVYKIDEKLYMYPIAWDDFTAATKKHFIDKGAVSDLVTVYEQDMVSIKR